MFNNEKEEEAKLRLLTRLIYYFLWLLGGIIVILFIDLQVQNTGLKCVDKLFAVIDPGYLIHKRL